LENVTNEEEGRLGAVGRTAIAGALLLATVLVVLVVTGGGGYTVKARFAAATQMVEGNLVQSGGRKVGLVKKIELTRDGQAELTLELDDEVAPLRAGTRATLRVASLSGIVNRYVDLQIPADSPSGPRAAIPENGVIPASDTTSAVDLDQLFALFDDDTKQGLQDVIRGSARQYAGEGEQARAGWRYLSPSFIAARRLFDELNRDTALFERFLVASSRLVTDVADRDNDLSALVDRLADTTGAIAAEEGSLSRAIAELPPFMRRANSTFVNLREALDDVDPLLDESRPVTPKLRAVLAELRPFAIAAKPVVTDLSKTIRRTGKDNDLIELGHATLPFRDLAIGPVTRNGKERPGSFVTSQKSLAGSRPHFAFLRPYSVDLTGWFDDFSHSGIYDANGSASRNALTVNAFALTNGVLQPIPQALREELFRQTAVIGQRDRCPGSAERPAPDGANPYVPDGLACDRTQIPPGT